MSDIDEQFDLVPHVDELLNHFEIVHLSNRSDIYHLTRQVLIDSMLTQDTYCFFYHILTKSIVEFNTMYGSFAHLIARNSTEADLYLNVDPSALKLIINYVQTTKINFDHILEINSEIPETIDLATMFGMPNLVASLRNAYSPEKMFMELMNNDAKLTKLLSILWRLHHSETYYDPPSN